MEFRRLGDEVDRAGGRVVSVKGALRAEQNVDALHVEEVDAAAERAGLERNLIQVLLHRPLLADAVIHHRDAANRIHGRRFSGDAVRLKLGDIRHEILGRSDLQVAQATRGQHIHGGRHPLNVLSDPLGRDHDLLQSATRDADRCSRLHGRRVRIDGRRSRLSRLRPRRLCL